MEHAGGGATAPGLSYQEALAYLRESGRFAVKLGLERTRALLKALDNPERGKRGALIAGTNGKGSTAAFLASILRHRGLRTALTISPHLRSYTERIQVDGRAISEGEFARALSELKPVLDRVTQEAGAPTEFEILIALALVWFRDRSDRLVVEVGLGGRLDSTNVLDLGVAVITNVSQDHRQYLGDTVQQIAGEKAGIIKPGNAVITAASAEALQVIDGRCREIGARWLWRLGGELEVSFREQSWAGLEFDVSGPGFHYEGLRTPLLGTHQAENAALAVAAAHALGDADPDSVRTGLAEVEWPGRLHLLPGRTLLDGAHNQEGMRRLVREVRRLIGDARLVVLVAAMKDKDVGAVLGELERLEAERVIFTRAASAGERALAPAELATMWPHRSDVVENAATALRQAQAESGPDGWVLACGSLYLVGELLS
ncbi:MAG: Mur ligase family protein [Candidatus Dormibacteraeota bacterium]|nr:Mur ligase family protein [Candidatus Dormibacteraeota bacterium]